MKGFGGNHDIKNPKIGKNDVHSRKILPGELYAPVQIPEGEFIKGRESNNRL